MEIIDFSLWKFSPDLTEGCEIKCHECAEWSCHTDWTETVVYCEDCGEHSAIECPKCGEVFEHVWSSTFETRVKNL